MNANLSRRSRSPLAMVAIATIGASVLVPAPGALAVTVDSGVAFARGQGVTITTTFDADPSATDPAVSFEGGVTRTLSTVDTAGVDGGAVRAVGAGIGLAGDADGITDIDFSVADSHAPSAEAQPDTGEKAAGDSATIAGLLSASALESTSEATDAAPTFTSVNTSTVAAASLLPTNDVANPVAPVSAESLASDASATGTGSPGVASASAMASSAAAEVAIAALDPVLALLTIDSIALATTATASTTAPGASTCTVVATTIGSAVTPPVEIDLTCAEFQMLLDPFLPLSVPGVGEVDLTFGAPVDTSGLPCQDQNGVVGVRLAVTTPVGPGSTIDIATSEACALTRSTDIDEPTVCGTVIAPPDTSSGHAAASATEVTDALSLVETGFVTADAAVDEAGLSLAPDVAPDGRGPAGADARTAVVGTDLYLPPNVPRGPLVDPTDTIRILDTDADAPAADSETFTLAALDATSTLSTGTTGVVAGSLAATAVDGTSTAATSGDTPGTLSEGDATAELTVDATTVGLDVDGDAAADVDLGATVLESKAHSDVSPTGVLSFASQTVNDLDASAVFEGVTVPVTADAIITTDTRAEADGVPGGATVDTTFSVLNLVVGGTTIATPDDNTDGRTDPSTTSMDVGGVAVEVIVGSVTETTTPDGQIAEISVDPVRIRISATPGSGPYTEIVLGHTEAVATTAAQPDAASDLVITTGLDKHFAYDLGLGQAGQITGPAGTPDGPRATIAPHQKFFIEICVGNRGQQSYSGAATVVLDRDVRLISEAPGDTIHAGHTVVGRRVTTADVTLAPGQEVRSLLFVEVRHKASKGQTIPIDISTAAGGVLADPLTVDVGLESGQPALRVLALSGNCNRNTRVWTLKVRIRNDGDATAYDARIDQVAVTKPAGTTVGGLLLSGSDVGPQSTGTTQTLTIGNVPGAPGTPCGGLTGVFREVARDAPTDGQLLAFD